ncbi:HAD domain-containing protein [Streptomyces roseolus]|uniref:HAD domain-containing protein n=1 Tax=Streptomyces roseolus TaxID=67358 RepID=UPI0036567664
MDTPNIPLVFLDVDGPLIPFGGSSRTSPVPTNQQNPLVDRIDPALGPLLSSLPCELIWATTWMDEANEIVGPLLGLPALAVVDWPDRPDDRIYEWLGLHWKTRTLVEVAAGRQFIWIDDEIGDNDRDWVAQNHQGRALLYRVDPRIGLQHSDFATLTYWVNDARPPSP